MKSSFSKIGPVLLVAGITNAAVVLQPVSVEARAATPAADGLLNPLITAAPLLGSVDNAISAIVDGVESDAVELAAVFDAFASIITAAKPTATPSDVTQAQASASRAFASYGPSSTPNIVEDAVHLIENGFTPDHAKDQNNPRGSMNNQNPKDPVHKIYPSASSGDAPYSIAESKLRGAISLPSKFSQGRTPLILVPGTGAPSAYANFGSNIGKLFQDSQLVDLVYLNIPDAVLDDIQVNAQYVAYAIGYVSGITGHKVAVATWSQGSLDFGWALQYWPSTRAKTQQVINYSADYHGTVNAYALNPGFPKLPTTPSVIQQEYNSTFIEVFRDGGGSSAYVPTTSIYSAFFDEIVQPQTLAGASAFIQDDRHVGVSNNEIQSICSGKPGGGFYTHEGVLFNPLAYALTVDALTHGGPGQPNRLDLNTVCNEIVAPGLDLGDVLATEAVIPAAALAILAYDAKMFNEPAIKKYAQ